MGLFFRRKPAKQRAGIGLSIGRSETGEVTVLEILGGSSVNGLVDPGDSIFSIDGISVAKLGMSEIQSSLMGEDGSEVTLAVGKKNNSQLQMVMINAKRTSRAFLRDTFEARCCLNANPSASSKIRWITLKNGCITILKKNPQTTLDAALKYSVELSSVSLREDEKDDSILQLWQSGSVLMLKFDSAEIRDRFVVQCAHWKKMLSTLHLMPMSSPLSASRKSWGKEEYKN